MMEERLNGVAKRLADAYESRDPEVLCERMQIRITDAALPQRIRGFFIHAGGVKAIVLSDALREERRFVLAHELGHVLLHPQCNVLFLKRHTYTVPARLEREADLFAGFLLVPMQELDGCLREQQSIQEIAARYRVPPQIVQRIACGALCRKGRGGFDAWQ